MIAKMEPLVSESLKDVFVARFESAILSGKFSSGELLPSERDLATQLQVSRPVVHEGLLELSVRGLVTLKPRSRAVVNNLKKEGSLSLLHSLMNYHGDNLAPHIQRSILDMRLLFEVENAALAANHITLEQLREMEQILQKEDEILSATDMVSREEITELDFAFHHLLCEASGNFIYPLLMNSFRPVYMELSSRFFSDHKLLAGVYASHKELYLAIQNKNEKNARKIMTGILTHGSAELQRILAQKNKVK